MKLEHWANIDKPLNPIKKLAKVAFINCDTELTLAILLHPIVISNKPLIKASQNSLGILNIDKGICKIVASSEIILNKDKTLKNIAKDFEFIYLDTKYY